jgi:hypothetical protein
VIYIAAFVLAVAYLIGGAPAVLAVLWWLLLAFVVVCGGWLLLHVLLFAFGVYLGLRRP